MQFWVLATKFESHAMGFFEVANGSVSGSAMSYRWILEMKDKVEMA